MYHDVKSVTPLAGFLLDVEFCNGTRKRYDVKPLFSRWEVFNVLKTGDLFSSVFVCCGGAGIRWNDDVDLDAEELWDFGQPVTPSA